MKNRACKLFGLGATAIFMLMAFTTASPARIFAEDHFYPSGELYPPERDGFGITPPPDYCEECEDLKEQRESLKDELKKAKMDVERYEEMLKTVWSDAEGPIYLAPIYYGQKLKDAHKKMTQLESQLVELNKRIEEQCG